MFKTAEEFGSFINGEDDDGDNRLWDFFSRLAEKKYYGDTDFPTIEQLEVEVIDEGDDVTGGGNYHIEGSHFWIIRHIPSNSYWRMEASIDSWYDDTSMGEGGAFYQVGPVERTITVYERLAD